MLDLTQSTQNWIFNFSSFSDRRRIQVRVMVFKAIFNNISVISWKSVLLVEETVVPGENHRPVPSHHTIKTMMVPQKLTLSHNVISSTSHHERDLISLAVGNFFSQGTPVSSTNKTDRRDITEIFILLKSGIKYHNPIPQ